MRMRWAAGLMAAALLWVNGWQAQQASAAPEASARSLAGHTAAAGAAGIEITDRGKLLAGAGTVPLLVAAAETRTGSGRAPGEAAGAAEELPAGGGEPAVSGFAQQPLPAAKAGDPPAAPTDLTEDALRPVYETLLGGSRVPDDRPSETPDQPTVYLTFDDGPSTHTADVLDILKKEGVKATFFELGQGVKAHPELTRRVLEEGHALGNHSYDHEYQTLYSSVSAFMQEIRQTDEAIAEATGRHVDLMRAPGGTYTNFDPFYFYYLQKAGYTVFDWNVDSGDSKRSGVPAAEIEATVKASPVYHETIVLMHDGAGHGETVKALPDIIHYYRDKGYAFGVLTGKVKPVVFHNGKPKWKRAAPTLDEFAAEAGRSEQRFAARQSSDAVQAESDRAAEETLEHQGAVSVTESTYALLKRPETLAVRMPDGTIREFTETKQMDTQALVPLRLLGESLGAKVTWNGEERVAQLQYGPFRLEYSLADLTLYVYEFGEMVRRVHLPELKLRDGTLKVPLADTVGWLGGQIHREEKDASEPAGGKWAARNVKIVARARGNLFL